MWFGGAHGATYNMRKAPNGDIYFTNSAGIGKIVPGGAPQLALPFPLRLENNLTVNTPGQIDVNGAGTLLFHSSTSAGDNRIFISERRGEATAGPFDRQPPRHPLSKAVSCRACISFAFDDTGRVLAQLTFRGADASRARALGRQRVAHRGDSRSDPRRRTPAHHAPQHAACIGIETDVRIDGSEWREHRGGMAAAGLGDDGEHHDRDAERPSRQQHWAIDINVGGDLLFQYANGVNSLVVRRGDKLHQVHNFFRPTPEGDFLFRMNSMDFRDDGTVYLLAVTQDDEVVLYEARPLF